MPANNTRIRRAHDICPGVIFVAAQTMPHQKTPKQRPFLAIKKIQKQIIALPLTSLKDQTLQEACTKHHRKVSSYYPISPHTNEEYDPIFSVGPGNFSGFIDLVTPMTLGTTTINFNFETTIVSKECLEKVLKAHYNLMQYETINVHRDPVPELTSSLRAKILKIAGDILCLSQQGILNKLDTERMANDIIKICEVLPFSPGASNTSEASENGEKLPASLSPCNENYLPIPRDGDDPSGGPGPGRGRRGGSRRGRSRARGNQRSRDPVGDRSGSKGDPAPQEAVECLEANLKEWDWEMMESDDQDGTDGCESLSSDDQEKAGITDGFGNLEWTWEILESESEVDVSGFSEESSIASNSPITGKQPLYINAWVSSMQDLREDLCNLELKSKITELPVIPRVSNMQETLTGPGRGKLLHLDCGSRPGSDPFQRSFTFTALDDKQFPRDLSAEKLLKSLKQSAEPASTIPCSKCGRPVVVRSTETRRCSEISTKLACKGCNNRTDVNRLQTPLRVLDEPQNTNSQEHGISASTCSSGLRRIFTKLVPGLGHAASFIGQGKQRVQAYSEEQDLNIKPTCSNTACKYPSPAGVLAQSESDEEISDTTEILPLVLSGMVETCRLEPGEVNYFPWSGSQNNWQLPRHLFQCRAERMELLQQFRPPAITQSCIHNYASIRLDGAYVPCLDRVKEDGGFELGINQILQFLGAPSIQPHLRIFLEKNGIPQDIEHGNKKSGLLWFSDVPGAGKSQLKLQYLTSITGQEESLNKFYTTPSTQKPLSFIHAMAEDILNHIHSSQDLPEDFCRGSNWLGLGFSPSRTQPLNESQKKHFPVITPFTSAEFSHSLGVPKLSREGIIRLLTSQSFDPPIADIEPDIDTMGIYIKNKQTIWILPWSRCGVRPQGPEDENKWRVEEPEFEVGCNRSENEETSLELSRASIGSVSESQIIELESSSDEDVEESDDEGSTIVHIHSSTGYD